ncbi:hypothetical protein ACK3TF_004331 [Chlorella vulgaris]
MEEGDDIFMHLAAVMGDEDDEDEHSEPAPLLAPGGKQPAGGPRLSWAAKAAAAGSAGAAAPGHQPRHAVLLPPGSIPCAPMSHALALPSSQPSSGGGHVAIFGAAAGSGSKAGGAAAAGGFSDVGQGSLVERYAGLKIKNPRVSHTQLRGRLADTSVLRLSQVKQRQRTAGLEGSWVTICVVGEKSKPRETATGRSYSIWKVTDLDQTSISLFLFSAAHSDLSRECEGTIVALMAPRASRCCCCCCCCTAAAIAAVKADGDFSLSVDSPEQVWVLGQSTEFGYCKAKTKSGDQCRMPVNALRCPYCPHHVQREYNRMKPTGRAEFQTSNLKTAFRQGLQRSLHWSPGDFEAAAKQQRIRSLASAQLQGVANSARHKGSAAGARYLDTVANPAAAAAAEAASQRRLTPAAAIAAAEAKGATAAAIAAAPIPAARPNGTLVLLLPQQKQKQQQQAAKRKAVGAAGGVGGSSQGGKRQSNGSRGARGSGMIGSTPAATMMVELDDDEEEEEAAAAAAVGTNGGVSGGGNRPAAYDPTAAARQRAVDLLRAAGGAVVPDPNSSSMRVPPVLAAAALLQQPASSSQPAAAAATAATGGRRTALAPMQAHRAPPLPSVVSGGAAAPRLPPAACRASLPASRASAAAGSNGGLGGLRRPPPQPAAPKSAMEAAFGGLLAEVEAAGAQSKGTRYKELVEDEEFEKLDKVMAALQHKDEMAARMETVTRLAVKAFHCKVCRYTAERRHPACAAHPRAVEKVEATKRWWQCCGCKYRFTTVNQRYPSGRCAKCNQPGTEFKSVSMLRPPKEHELQRQQSRVASREQLATRGAEQNRSMPLNVQLNFPKRPGFICLEGEARIGISAHLLFQLISHADNSAILSNLNHVRSLRAIASRNNFQVQEVEHETIVSILGFKGRVTTPLRVEHDYSTRTMTYRLAGSNCWHLTALEGCWRVLPDGPSGSLLQVEQALQPRGVPPILSAAIRSITAGQVRGTFKDLHAEAQRIIAGSPTLDLAPCPPNQPLPDDAAATSDASQALAAAHIPASARQSNDELPGHPAGSDAGSRLSCAPGVSSRGGGGVSDAAIAGRLTAAAIAADSAAGPASFPLSIARLLSCESAGLELPAAWLLDSMCSGSVPEKPADPATGSSGVLDAPLADQDGTGAMLQQQEALTSEVASRGVVLSGSGPLLPSAVPDSCSSPTPVAQQPDPKLYQPLNHQRQATAAEHSSTVYSFVTPVVAAAHSLLSAMLPLPSVLAWSGIVFGRAARASIDTAGAVADMAASWQQGELADEVEVEGEEEDGSWTKLGMPVPGCW